MGIKVFWCTLSREDGKDNFGDILAKYLIEKISKRNVEKIPHPSMRRYKYFIKHYLTIGSILEVANTNSVVWGSGIIRSNQFVKKAKFLAVRGPRTRTRLLELGYRVPNVLGDPAILLPKYFQSTIEKRYKVGIIPHYINYDEVYSVFGQDSRIKIINLMTDNIEATISDILECETIISSSLHGVIVSQAYQIPTLWIQFSEKLAGDNVKFYDYFESLDILYKKEFITTAADLDYEKIVGLMKDNKSILLPSNDLLVLRQNQLLESCPFL